jgi:hypothetical protein
LSLITLLLNVNAPLVDRAHATTEIIGMLNVIVL